MKKILFIVFLLFTGCANKNYIFIPTSEKCIKKTDVKIGIKEMKLPYYMKDLEIMERKNFKLISTHTYLSKEPTEIVVEKLSNKLCDSNVFIYPWKEGEYIISIKIDDFYFQNKSVYLNARIYIKSKFFKVKIIKKCNNNYKCINEVFDEIINKIVKEIK